MLANEDANVNDDVDWRDLSGKTGKTKHGIDRDDAPAIGSIDIVLNIDMLCFPHLNHHFKFFRGIQCRHNAYEHKLQVCGRLREF